MKTKLDHHANNQKGYALLLTLVFLGLGVMLLMATMSWTSETSRLTDRNNEYYTSADAAEAATEKVLVRLSRDYLSGGEQAVYNSLASYKTNFPTASDNPYWTRYNFSNPEDGTAGLYVTRATNWQYSVMDGEFSGLYGNQATYRIISNAQLTNSNNANLIAAVKQDIGVESIPIFQFAIFYNEDLEMNPSPAMVVNGRVHANGNIYTLPATSLTFAGDVTASGFLTNTFKPGDPLGNRGISSPVVNFQGEHLGGTSTLNLPLGAPGTSTNVYQILQVPPAGESITTGIGANRFFNKADLIILVYETNVVMRSSVTTVPGWSSTTMWTNFLTVSNVIFNAREGANVRTAQIDIGKFNTWATNSTNPVTPLLQAKPLINVLYVADMRSPYVTNYTTNSTGVVKKTVQYYEPGVYLKNGARLPSAGLTIASPDPIYVCGDYNVTTNGVNFSRGTNDTTYTYPAAIIGDAINILSSSWTDANSSSPIASRVAGNTTVNAAFLAGIVPTGTYNGVSCYSGGVENFPRFLENWNSPTKTFTYNGSMVVMFNSQVAIAPWATDSSAVYSPPVRKWSFDKNFLSQNKLPPATPQILFIERLGWAFVPPKSTGP